MQFSYWFLTFFFILKVSSGSFDGSFDSSSDSGSRCQASGCEWQSRIYFDPNAESIKDQAFYINEKELKMKFKELVDMDEQIESITLYSSKLFESQDNPGQLFYHAYVVLKTKHWWWSIEKNSKGITIQRSKEAHFVIDKYRRTDRLSPLMVRKEGLCNDTMDGIINWLYYNGELGKTYHFLDSNCHQFAEGIFKFFATNVKNYTKF